MLCASLIASFYKVGDAESQRVYLHTLGLATSVHLDSYFATWLATHTSTLLGWATANPVEFAVVRAFLETIDHYYANERPM